MTGDEKEGYRKAGIFTLNKCQNIIIRNLKFVGSGSVDVGGNDLISSTGAEHHLCLQLVGSRLPRAHAYGTCGQDSRAEQLFQLYHCP
jgi:hypothetical protein